VQKDATLSAETLVKRPESTKINNGDLDSGRDFVISVTTMREPAA